MWSVERQASTAMSVTPCRSRRGMQCRSSSRPRADTCAAHSFRKTKPNNDVKTMRSCRRAQASARERGPAIGGVARQPRESPAAVGAGRGDVYRSPAPRLSGAWHAIKRTHTNTYVRTFLPLGNRCQSTYVCRPEFDAPKGTPATAKRPLPPWATRRHTYLTILRHKPATRSSHKTPYAHTREHHY